MAAVFYLVFTLYGTYEVIQHNKLHYFYNYFLALIGLIIWIFPLNLWQDIDQLFWTTKTSNITNFLQQYIGGKGTLIYQSFIAYIIVFVAVSLVMLINLKNYKNTHDFISYYLITLFSIIYLPLTGKLLFIYNTQNLYLFFAVALIPMIVDTFGYFGGMLLGHKLFKRKFCPKISPKKTWEGAIVSYLFGAIFVFILMYLGKLTNNHTFTIFNNYIQLIVGIIFLPAIAIIGDLLFSLLKRRMKVKDFSNLIPGHGGLMDRFDSLSLVIMATSIILLF
ncbi:phosphatidate cytidylyltransferase [Metamycoplasma arthritidis]|uniref:phosphatidate cytidylyltransferase n=1 Tax=Metamycoplasma arthritidis TaxID=2111 RepID=UPI0013EBAC80|nr:phosphatidate cytidylyltransferase [Metamycoplasma arthritidis]